MGKPVNVEIRGDDFKVLQKIAREYEAYLKTIKGVYDIKIDTEPGKLEYRYSLNERGRELGLTQQQLADAVRTGFLGLEAVHVTWGDERIPVRVIYTDAVRRNSSLATLPITLNDGRIVYLGDVADIDQPAATAFMVQKAHLARIVLHFRLVTVDTPFLVLFTAVLDAGVAVLDAEFNLEDEVLEPAAPPDAEGIAFGRIFRRRLTANRALDDLPQPRVAIPAGQVLAIKYFSKARLEFFIRCRTPAAGDSDDHPNY